jgi:hypothetical protein
MRIGLIDHHLNNYHTNKFFTLLNGPIGENRFEFVSAYESNPEGEDWCAKNNVPRASSPAEVIRQSDAVMVVAPDNIESHLELAREALTSGKPLLIDKYLSPVLKDAQEIVRLTQGSNTPLMSSSSLRFSEELEQLIKGNSGPIETAFSRGFGEWSGYACHSVAPLLRVMGTDVKRLINTGTKNQDLVTIDFGDRRAFVEIRLSENQYEATPWQVGVLSGGRYEVVTVSKFDAFYENLMKAYVQFATTGISPVPAEEQLATVAIEEAAITSREQGGKWVDVRI